MLLIKFKTKLQLHLSQPVNIDLGPRKFHVFQKIQKCWKNRKKSCQNIFESVLCGCLGVEENATADIFRITPQISHLAPGSFRLSVKISYFCKVASKSENTFKFIIETQSVEIG